MLVREFRILKKFETLDRGQMNGLRLENLDLAVGGGRVDNQILDDGLPGEWENSAGFDYKLRRCRVSPGRGDRIYRRQ